MGSFYLFGVFYLFNLSWWQRVMAVDAFVLPAGESRFVNCVLVDNLKKLLFVFWLGRSLKGTINTLITSLLLFCVKLNQCLRVFINLIFLNNFFNFFLHIIFFYHFSLYFTQIERLTFSSCQISIFFSDSELCGVVFVVLLSFVDSGRNFMNSICTEMLIFVRIKE